MRRSIFHAAVITVALGAAPAQASVIFFSNNAAGFAAAMAGNSSLGVEDFEGSTLLAGVQAMNDPLVQGVANSLYPTGLAKPVTVQSNIFGTAAVTPSPRGLQGLAALAAGSAGATSDVIVANTFTDSLDLIFSAADQIRGVGFNTLNFQFTENVLVQVFNTSNALLGSTTIAANPAGDNHLGIEATGADVIGRVNIFSIAEGNEGADNIELFSASTVTRVAEPASLALIVSGLMGRQLSLRRRRRRE
jgi:hypothetical protein